MKQFLVLSLMTVACGFGALQSPFWGVLLYYALAVLRPQYIWAWALPIDVRWSLAAALITLVSVAIHLPRLVARGAISLVAVLLGLFGVLLLLSVLTAYNPALAQHWGIEYAKILLIAGVACIVLDQLWQLRVMGVMILAMLGYVAWEINSLYLFQGRLDIYHTGYGGLDNNGAALMIGMGLPFAYAFALGNRGPGQWWKTATCAVLGGCIAHAVMLSYSRGAMLAVSLGMAWLLLHHRRRWQAAGMAAVLIAAVAVMAGPEVRERFLSIRDYEQDASAQSRLDSWAAAWQIVWDDPVLGKGVRNSNLFSQNYGADRHGRTIHNQYLQIAADSGMPAAIVYVTLLGVAIVNLGRSRRWCADHLAEHDEEDDDSLDAVRRMEKVFLAMQTSLLIFAIGAVFLSLEVFELPWLLIVLGGVAPRVVRQHLESTQESRSPEVQNETPPSGLLDSWTPESFPTGSSI